LGAVEKALDLRLDAIDHVGIDGIANVDVLAVGNLGWILGCRCADRDQENHCKLQNANFKFAVCILQFAIAFDRQEVGRSCVFLIYPEHGRLFPATSESPWLAQCPLTRYLIIDGLKKGVKVPLQAGLFSLPMLFGNR
jgi:hypothetical protein